MTATDVSLLLLSKNFAANANVSHIGLGVAGMNNQKVLRQLGVKADVQQITSINDVRPMLEKTPRTHVVISALWLPTSDLQRLAHDYPETQFAVNCHSNVGFLQADPRGTELFRQGIDLEQGVHNFRMCGNNQRFADWVSIAYSVPCGYLPNLYYLNGHTPVQHVTVESDGVLRIGCFGATRPLKNIVSCAGAALAISHQLRRPLEFWVSAGRMESGGQTVMDAVKGLIGGLPNVSIKLNGWCNWPQFRRTVGTMHMMLQVSYTESFNMVTADGVAMGVPSVVSDAIDWAPDYWVAPVDDVARIAQVGLLVQNHKSAARDGLNALVTHNTSGAQAWSRFLGVALPPYRMADK